MRSNGPSRSSRPLATQFSATPPERQRSRSPLVACRWRAARSTTSSVTFWTDAATSIVCCVIGSSGRRGGASNSRWKRSLVMRRPAT